MLDQWWSALYCGYHFSLWTMCCLFSSACVAKGCTRIAYPALNDLYSTTASFCTAWTCSTQWIHIRQNQQLVVGLTLHWTLQLSLSRLHGCRSSGPLLELKLCKALLEWYINTSSQVLILFSALSLLHIIPKRDSIEIKDHMQHSLVLLPPTLICLALFMPFPLSVFYWPSWIWHFVLVRRRLRFEKPISEDYPWNPILEDILHVRDTLLVKLHTQPDF